jgi:glycosyltransferase involved in cell wall biosynthesis
MSDGPKTDIALVHDFFIVEGGAEKVFYSLMQLPYRAALYTSISFKKDIKGQSVITSFMQKLPFLKKFLIFYKNLLPYAFESLTFPDNIKLIISDTASFAKFIVPPPGAKHISYIHTPPRFLWNLETTLKIRRNFFLRFIYNLLLGTTQRMSDYLAARRVHELVANSEEVQTRIKKFYRRDATIINPPVEISNIIEESKKITKKNDKYLIFGRVEAYKGIEELLDIWPANRNITIAGTGSLLPSLMNKYQSNKNITFTGTFVPESEKVATMSSHKAMFLLNKEDFGIVIAEVIAAGTPVIALAKGGALEIIKHKVNGYLVPEISAKEIEKAIEWVESLKNDEQTRLELQETVIKFDNRVFLDNMQSLIKKTLDYE